MPPDHRFCGQCGTSLEATPESAGDTVVARVDAVPPPRAERRLVSVLFVDLVGFTTLSEHTDPEVVRELQTDYFEQARTVVARYGGTIEKFIGDAVVAVWGTPVAREDDAERTVRAGLDLLDAVSALGEQRAGQELRARAGVATGQAAVRLDAVDQGMVTGDVVNSAARIQTLAEPGALWVDDATREASSRAITYAVAGDHELKGRTESVRLFAATQVVAGSGGAQRFDGLEAPFVGRERDLRVIKELFHDSVEQSRARLVVVSGGAGVGKSRLGWEFFKYVDGISQVCSWHVGRCLSYGEGVGYWALAEMMRMRLRIADGDAEPVAVGKLDAGLDAHVPDPEERTWLRPRLAMLLGLDGAAGPSATELERDTLFAGWRLFLERLAEADPVVLVFEDLQYADTGLLDFIDHLLEWSAGLPIFVLALTRPELQEQRPAWGGHRSVTTLYLDPLGDEPMEEVVDALVRGLPADTRRALAARAEGIPLFAIETVRMLIDRDLVVPRGGEYVLADEVGDLSELDVPPTLQALVAARLDNLPDDERRLVKDAAVLGLSFAPDSLVAMVHAVGGVDPDRVEALLVSLARREVLTVQADARSPEAGQYRFEQKVMRAVAYETLSRRDRRSRHLAAAEHLLATREVDDVAGVLATHYLNAADAVPDAEDAATLRSIAVEHLERAGDRARALAASDEALRHYERALVLVEADDDRMRLAERAGGMARRTGDYDRALVLLEAARGLFLDARRPLDVARVAALQGDVLVDLDRFDEALRLMTAAHAGAETDRPEAEVAALANMIAIAHVAVGDNAAAAPWVERSLITAEAAGAWEELGRALNLKGLQLYNSGRTVEGRGLLRVALDLAREHGVRDRIATQSANLALFSLERDLAEAERLAREALAQVPRLGDRRVEAFSLAALSLVQLYQGAWDDIAVSDLRRLLRLSGSMGLSLLVPIAALAAWRGQPELLDGVDDLLVQSFDDVQVQTLILTTRALAAEAQGDLPGALAAGRAAVEEALAAGMHEELDLAVVTAVSAAMETGQLEPATRLLDVWSERPQGVVTPLFLGLRAWLHGLLASRLGQDGAGAHLERATAVLDELGTAFWLARARADHAEWLARRGEAVRAHDVASQALATFDRLGATPAAARARQVVDALDAEAMTRAD